MQPLVRLLESKDKLMKNTIGITGRVLPFHTFQLLKLWYEKEGFMVEKKWCYEEAESDALINCVPFIFQSLEKIYFEVCETEENLESIKINFSAKKVVWVHANMASKFENDFDLYNPENSVNQSVLVTLQEYVKPELHFFLEEIFSTLTLVSYEELLNYMRYAPCVQKSLWKQYLIDLHEDRNISSFVLFDLADHFFQKNAVDFFALWQKIFLVYPAEFWSVYWSEQLWLAYSFCKKRTTHKDQLTYIFKKLPRSFINYTHKKYKSEMFVSLLSDLARFDNAIKLNDSASIILDRMLLQWFSV